MAQGSEKRCTDAFRKNHEVPYELSWKMRPTHFFQNIRKHSTRKGLIIISLKKPVTASC